MAADLVSAVFRTSILQSAAPDEMRGRLFGLNIVVVTGGPRLADVRAGAVAVMFSPITAVVSGGITCLVALGSAGHAVPGVCRGTTRERPRQSDRPSPRAAPVTLIETTALPSGYADAPVYFQKAR